ncbi:MAG: DMT family transporter, partial [Leptolyngbyaceae cyanobacterium bins.59]|nr:DMT family transporter [Leptolyngbyaceae cyanobacterium bins.59]
MTTQLEFSTESPFKTISLPAIAALLFALVSISLSAILIKVGERELSPEAIAFNRFWITALVLGVWQGINRLRPSAKKVAEDPGKPTLKPFWLIGGLIAAGFLFTADLVLWGWSLTQTTVANATLLANLTPLFTTLGAWLIWGKTVDARFLGGLGIALGGMAGLT